MEEQYKCPKCNQAILHGINPCPHCKSPLAWSGRGPIIYLPPIDLQLRQISKTELKPAANIYNPKIKPTLAVAIIIAVFLFAIGIAAVFHSSSPSMTFETIGIKGSTVFITLVSPNPDAVTPEDLANKLRADWQDQLNLNTNRNYQNQVHVMVFDNKDAPQRWLEIWDRLENDQEWSKEQAQIFPHRIANYDKNTTSGLNEVQILSRDTEGTVVSTIKF